MSSSQSIVRLALAFVLLVSSSLLAVHGVPARHSALRSRDVPFPQDDPFYSPPEGYASQPNGAVLASRKVTTASFGFLPIPVESYQLLYRTTALNGTAIASVTTVFKPFGAKLDRFVNFHTAEDSAAPQCAPSYNYRIGANQTNIIVAIESLSIETYLFQGYIVNSPDYEGPDSAFTAGRLSGRAVLDSMRAVQNFAATLKLADNAAIAGVGYSGGAIAVGWAASLRASYAPELNVKGWAMGGVPANLSAVVDNIDGTFFAGFLPTAIAGLSKPSSYGAQANPIIADIAEPKGLAALEYANTHCQADVLGNFSYQSVKSKEFQKLGDQFLYDERVRSILKPNLMGVVEGEQPTIPTFVYQSLNDEIIPYNETTALVDRWCAQGSPVQFTTLKNGGHISGEIVALADVSNFVKNAFAGKVSTSGCTRKTKLSSILNPVALGASLEPLLFKFVDILHQVGENDSNVKKSPAVILQPPAL